MISGNYVTKAQAAAMLNVNRLTIWRWVKTGKLKAEKVGRELLIKRDDLSQLTKNKTGRKVKSI